MTPQAAGAAVPSRHVANAGESAGASEHAAAGGHDARDGAHFVRVYEDERDLVRSVCDYARDALQLDAAAILIATTQHIADVRALWTSEGFDAQPALDSGRLTLLDAEATLAAVIRGDAIGREEFFEVVGSAIAEALRRHGRVAAFGEMVALLWARERADAALELEQLWNELLTRYRFSLYCAYPFDAAALASGAFDAVRAQHAPEPCAPAHGERAPRIEAVGDLQRRSAALHEEVAARLDAEEGLARLAAIVSCSDDAIISKSLEGRIQSWNAGAERIFGYRGDEVIGKPITLLIPPELHQQEDEILAKLRRGERIDHFETERVTRDGRRIPVSLTVSPVRNARGQIIGASKIARDISERRRAEESLLRSESRLTAEVAALAKLNEWSSRLWRCRTLGEGLQVIVDTVVDLVGAPMGALRLVEKDELTVMAVHGFDPALARQVEATPVRGDTPYGRLLCSGQRQIVGDIESAVGLEPFRELARKAGIRSVVTTPLVTGEGVLLGIVSAHFDRVHRPSEQELRRVDLHARQAGDFIRRCRTEEDLRRSEEALREADRRKNEFLATLAHELRNPLAPIRYAVAMAAKSGRTPNQQKRAEEIIARQVEHMSRLLDDLLDISRITHGTLVLKKRRIELASVMGTAIEAARPALDAKGHVLLLDLPKEPVRLDADPVRLAQVFSNLLINAAKYTHPGGHIQLQAQRAGDEIIVSVRDDGIGIQPVMMPRLFTLFAQAASALEHAEGGLGVGLAIVRGLVELHGGSVEARSEGLDRGSEFIVRLPLGANARDLPAQDTGTAVAADAARLRILVADDNQDAAEACATLLELCGHRVRVAFDGREALRLAAEFRPHVMLLDIGMPKLNGYEVARETRAEPWGRDVVLIALTGWGQDEDRRRTLAAGFDRHLTKPIDPEEIERLLQTIAADVAAAASAERDHSGESPAHH